MLRKVCLIFLKARTGMIKASRVTVASHLAINPQNRSSRHVIEQVWDTTNATWDWGFVAEGGKVGSVGIPARIGVAVTPSIGKIL